MLVGLGAALRREAGRLVDDDRRCVLVDDQAADELDLVVAELRPRRRRLLRRRRPVPRLAAARGCSARPRSGRRASPRLPSTRSCPVRAQRDTWPKLTSGRLRLNQRSRRMPSSSSVTVKLRTWLPRSCRRSASATGRRGAASTSRSPRPGRSKRPGRASPRSIISQVSRLNAEKVVKPPSTPTARNSRVCSVPPARTSQPASSPISRPPSKVHDQGAPREARPEADKRRRADQMARAGADRAAEHDEKEIGHRGGCSARRPASPVRYRPLLTISAISEPARAGVTIR